METKRRTRYFKKTGGEYVSLPGAGHEDIQVVIEPTIFDPKRYSVKILYRGGRQTYAFENRREYPHLTGFGTWSLSSARYWATQILEWSRQRRFRRKWFGPKIT
jgi:hypothetical protein